MSFVFSNSLTYEFIDIVDGRTVGILNNYFSRFSEKARFNVKSICIDIYSPYMKLIRKKFPNTDIIIDRFHLIQNINRKLNSTRMKLMHKYKGKNYTLLKNNWKLILADEDKVTFYKFIYNKSFKSYVTRLDILKYLLELDKIFKVSYERVHYIRRAVNYKNEAKFKRLIEVPTTELSKSVKVGIINGKV